MTQSELNSINSSRAIIKFILGLDMPSKDEQLLMRQVFIESDPLLIERIGKIFASHPVTTGFALHDERVRDHCFFVIIDTNENVFAAASGCIDEVDPRMFKLLNLIVRDDHQGFGLGSWFLERIEREVKDILYRVSRDKGGLRMRLIPGGNSAPFYSANGYVQVDFFMFKNL